MLRPIGITWRHVWIQLFCILPISVIVGDEAVITAQGDIRMSDTIDDVATTSNGGTKSAPYGVDTSWPMHHQHVTDKAKPLGDSVQSMYSKYISGCEAQSKKCQQYESDRLEMNLLQPSAMLNYTHAGYAKVLTPPILKELIQEFWAANRGKEVKEVWDSGNTYVNHWESPTYMLDLGRKDLLTPGTIGIREEIVQQVKSILEAWTQHSLVVTSIYGVRVYREGAILAPHVDRLPLVSSAIINVAQDVAEPWILEVIGHNGQAANLTMAPGEMVLYESHSIIHGRPFPLNGNYFANIFVHFEPVGHTLRHSQSGAYGSELDNPEQAKEGFQEAMKYHLTEPKKEGAHTEYNSPDIPPYIHPTNHIKWKQEFEYDKEAKAAPKPTKAILGLISVHAAAADGDLATLMEIAKKDRSQLFKSDRNGWRPLHEAARGGRTKVIEYLIEEGAQINERTNHGKGGNALWWALKKPIENARTIAILKKHGAVSLAPRDKNI